MANLFFRNIPAAVFFQYASGLPSLELIDIVNEAEFTKQKSFADDPGFFVYRSQLVVNDRRASLFGVTGINVKVYTTNPQKFSVPETSAIASFDIEFETQDEVTRTIAGNNDENSIKKRFSEGDINRVYASTSVIRADGVSVPATSVQKIGSSYKKISKKARINGVDPASLSSTGNFATLDLQNAASLSQQSDDPITGLRKSKSIYSQKLLTGRSLHQLRHSSRAARRGNQNNEIARSKDTKTETSTSTKTTLIELIPSNRLIERTIFIPKDEISGASRLYVRATAITKDLSNFKFSPKQSVIDHTDQLTDFLSNPEPPEVMITGASYAFAELRIKRTDPTLSQVRIVRIIDNPYFRAPVFENLGDISFSDQNIAVFRDLVDNVKPNRVTYRFSVVNGDGSIGEFSSVVVPSFKKVTDPTLSASTPVSILAQNKGARSEISVYTLDENIFSMRLLRQDLGTLESFNNSIVNIPNEDEEYETLIRGAKTLTRFFDETAVLGKKYRYFVAYRLGEQGDASIGQEVISDEDETLVRRFPTEKIPFSINVTDPVVSTESLGTPASSFSIDVVEETELFNSILKALRDAGVGEQFISELQADKIKARNFLMFIVERYDVATGRKISFGITPPGSFSDNAAIRQQKNLPPPTPGGKYVYVFKVCMQDPAVFLQSSLITLNTRLQKEIKKKASRFSRKIFSRLGVLPAETEVKRGVTIEKLIEESQFGIEISKTVSYPKSQPKISSLSIRKRSFFNKIDFSLSGDVREVSYFNVYCSVNGEENLLGSISASPESGFYGFRDDRYHSAVGNKAYRVTAVSFKDDETVSSPVAKDKKRFSMPDNMVVGNVFGSFGRKNKIKPIAPNESSHKSLYPPKPKPDYIPEDLSKSVDFSVGLSDILDRDFLGVTSLNQSFQSEMLSLSKPNFGQSNISFLNETMKFGNQSQNQSFGASQGSFLGDSANQETFSPGPPPDSNSFAAEDSPGSAGGSQQNYTGNNSYGGFGNHGQSGNKSFSF